jgi:hypothetical protein
MKTIRVKHLIEALQKYDPELEVHLDKDGWMADDLPNATEVQIIQQRGLWTDRWSKGQYLIINN